MKRLSPKQAATQVELAEAMAELIAAHDKVQKILNRGRWDKLAWIVRSERETLVYRMKLVINAR